MLSLRGNGRRREIDAWAESSRGHVGEEVVLTVERLKGARGWVEDEVRQVWVEGIDARWPETAGGGGRWGRSARARAREEEEKGGERVTAPEGDK